MVAFRVPFSETCRPCPITAGLLCELGEGPLHHMPAERARLVLGAIEAAKTLAAWSIIEAALGGADCEAIGRDMVRAWRGGDTFEVLHTLPDRLQRDIRSAGESLEL